MFTTSDRVQHAQMRRLMSRSFTRNQILSYEPKFWDKAKLLSGIIAEQYDNGEALDFVFAFRCLALDVISTFIFGESFNALYSPRFREPILEAFDNFVPANIYVGRSYR